MLNSRRLQKYLLCVWHMNIPQQPEGRAILQPRLIQLLVQLHSVPVVNNNKLKLNDPNIAYRPQLTQT